MKGFDIQSWSTPVEVLIAKLRELGREKEITNILKTEHSWEDVSYHGSANYRCEYCGVSDRDEKRYQPCPNAVQEKAQQLIVNEQKELREYRRLRAERERYRYLAEKFGDLE